MDYLKEDYFDRIPHGNRHQCLIDGDIDAGDSNFKRTSEEIFLYRHNEWQRFNDMQVHVSPPPPLAVTAVYNCTERPKK